MHPKDIIKVTRILEYMGPREWVMKTLSNSVIGKESPSFLHPPRSIRELSLEIAKMEGGDS